MHNMVWKGEEGGDSDDEYSRSNASRTMDGDSDSDGSDGSDDVSIDIDRCQTMCVVGSFC